jgi:hypothetical protein
VKQAWRLISKPESLCATVLRAKYYSDGDLLEEILKMGSSYTWQSIMCGVNTLKKGYIWRVGDGSKINIWNDAWIPGSHDRKIVTRRGHNLLTHVSDLIDPITDRWDEELVKQTFWSIDIGRILAIPLTDSMEDFIAWHYNKNGVFSVKSAYHVEWDFQHGQKLRRTNGVGNSTVNPVWGKLWNLNIAVKVNIFLWKALHATMPCRAILANRHIKISGQRLVCCAGAEDIKHACQVVLEHLLCLPRRNSLVLDQRGLQETMTVAAWYIWWERRQCVNGEFVQLADRSVMSINALVVNMGKSYEKNMKMKMQTWARPPSEFLKLNVDAGFDLDQLTDTT